MAQWFNGATVELTRSYDEWQERILYNNNNNIIVLFNERNVDRCGFVFFFYFFNAPNFETGS